MRQGCAKPPQRRRFSRDVHVELAHHDASAAEKGLPGPEALRSGVSLSGSVRMEGLRIAIGTTIAFHSNIRPQPY